MRAATAARSPPTHRPPSGEASRTRAPCGASGTGRLSSCTSSTRVSPHRLLYDTAHERARPPPSTTGLRRRETTERKSGEWVDRGGERETGEHERDAPPAR